MGVIVRIHFYYIIPILFFGDCNYKKEDLLLGRKDMTNLDSVFKSSDITLQQRSVWSKLWVFQ